MNKYVNLNPYIVSLLTIVVSGLLGAALTVYFYNKNLLVSKQKNKEAVTKLIEEVWSKGNDQLIEELVSPQYTIRHDPGDQWEGQTLDHATFKTRVKHSRGVFPDQKFYIEDIVGEDDKVAVSWRFVGTQKGDLPGIPASNKAVNFSGVTIYYFSNGKMVGHWQIVDRLGMFESSRH